MDKGSHLVGQILLDRIAAGVADGGTSIGVRHSFIKNDFKGYLEDPRPNAQGAPYQIDSPVLKTIPTVSTDMEVSTVA